MPFPLASCQLRLTGSFFSTGFKPLHALSTAEYYRNELARQRKEVEEVLENELSVVSKNLNATNIEVLGIQRLCENLKKHMNDNHNDILQKLKVYDNIIERLVDDRVLVENIALEVRLSLLSAA